MRSSSLSKTGGPRKYTPPSLQYQLCPVHMMRSSMYSRIMGRF